MTVPLAPVLHDAIESALHDSAADYEARGILVIPHLEAKNDLGGETPALYQAVYTIFRGLPARLPSGVVLFVWTRDRAGGDVELIFEAREDPAHEHRGEPRALLSSGPYGDLFDLALLGLESICRARSGLVERPEEPAGETTSPLGRAMANKVRRRYLFIIPSADKHAREPYARESGNRA